MTVRLSDMSDAQLGALVRRSLSEEAVEAMLRDRPKAQKRAKKASKKAKRLQKEERERRRNMEPLPGFVLGGIVVPDLDVSDVLWHEVAPLAVSDTYRSALLLIDPARVLDDPAWDPWSVTWGTIQDIHRGIREVLPDEKTSRKIAVLMTVAGITYAEAHARVASLSNTTTKG